MSNIKQVFRNRISKKKLPTNGIGEVLSQFRSRQYTSALGVALNCMSVKNRVVYVAHKFCKSKYSAYSSAMIKFKSVLDAYSVSGDSKIMKDYMLELDETAKNENYSMNNNEFFNLRKRILVDAIDNSSDIAFHTLLQIESVTHSVDTDRRYIKLICEICKINWPDNQALEVLFL